MTWPRKWVILLHRYLSIPLSVLFFVWFASGIAMVFAGGMPSVTNQERLARMPPLDLARIRLSPVDAVDAANGPPDPGRLQMLTVMDRPAYRFSGLTVFADDGQMLARIDSATSVRIAARFMNLPESAVHVTRRLTTADQWTIGQRRQVPLDKVVVEDADHTELYVSARTAEVVMKTTRATRSLAWVAAIPHWLYFTPLRLHDLAWTRTVLWASAIGAVSVLLGLILAVTQYRVRYVGLMWWHYVLGVAFGLCALTWVVSGFLSMQPGDWASSGNEDINVQAALVGGPLDVSQFPPIDRTAVGRWLGGRAIKEIDFLRVQGDPYYLARADDQSGLIDARSMEERREGFSVDSVIKRVIEGYPGVPIVETALLPFYDAYYYDRNREAPLPVLRVKFGDEEATWVYVDPAMSRLVGQFTRRARVERWLYHGLHSLDFSFWYYNRPVWEAGVIALCGGGAVLSFVGVLIGLKRVRRGLRALTG